MKRKLTLILSVLLLTSAAFSAPLQWGVAPGQETNSVSEVITNHPTGKLAITLTNDAPSVYVAVPVQGKAQSVEFTNASGNIFVARHFYVRKYQP